MMQREGDLVGVGGAPDDEAFELNGIVGDVADFDELGFDALGVSHGDFRMAQLRQRSREPIRAGPMGY